MNSPGSHLNRAISVAPMLDWTDRHCRYFMRLLTQHSVLYTEMVTTGALIFGKGDYLRFHQQEHPVALQLGGSDVSDMRRCAEMAQHRGYDEVNINVGCPSDRVQNGRFGACLMAEPQTVADCVSSMQAAVDIPVTVKSRIGIDDMDEYEDLSRFIDTVASAGCTTFIVHARKAWLQGLSPKQNREIPPLMYDRVYQLKSEFPDLHISINGGIKTLEEAKAHLQHVDGVMIGREAYANPFMLSEVDHVIYGEQPSVLGREQVVEQMIDYAKQEIAASDCRIWHIARHMLGLFQGQPGGRHWRRHLSQHGTKRDADHTLLKDALNAVLQAQAAAESFTQSRSSEFS
ncbi:tRNA dihydrouridine(20/20a) synthase DusA [Aestuariibacter salexigens]|uniref:tRNA dihydrouridine(20/20a) synthase DusA n=1 Tax=Aestuariibacter salexigens TaxID=226010 RepID=UPI00047E41CF|nr:tRNA dihydrouridine(20/20a) synthase DusA [Aestuariibacter salexigens]